MEEVTEQDNYEFEMLLGEIPNMTSENPHSAEPASMKSPSGLQGNGNKNPPSPSALANFYSGSPAGSPGRNPGFYNSFSPEKSSPRHVSAMQDKAVDQKFDSNGDIRGLNLADHQLSSGKANREDSNLPDEQSLASALAQLSFKDGVTNGYTGNHLVNHRRFSNRTFLLEDQYLQNIKQPQVGFDARSCSSSSPRSPISSNGGQEPSKYAAKQPGLPLYAGVANGESSCHSVSCRRLPNCPPLLEDQYRNKLKQPPQGSLDSRSGSSSSPRSPITGNGGQEPSKFAGQQPSSPLYAASPTLAQNIPSFPGLHTNYAPRVGFSGVPYQQQCVFSTQSAAPYVQQPQVNRPHIPYQYIDEDSYYWPRQQRYLSQFRSDALDGNRPNQTNSRIPNGHINGGGRLSPLNMYSAHQFSQNDPLWENGSMQSFDRLGRHNFPEKMLTKSDGLNMLKAIDGSSSRSNGFVCHIDDEKLLSDNHYHQQYSILNSGSLLNDHLHHQSTMLNSGSLSNGHLHSQSSMPSSGSIEGLFSSDSSPDSLDPRMYNLKSQPPKYNSLDEVVGSIYFVAKDQHGCRFLQKKCAEGCAEDVQKIFVEIIGHIVELMTDPFGNYLVQKLLEVCTNDQKMKILHAITKRPGDLVRISLDMHGTRAVQKVVETLSTPEQFSLIVSSLKPGIINLMKDTNGNHVAQRCLQHLVAHYKEYLFEDAVAHCIKLAKDRHACCVLQKCLSHCDGEHRRRLVCGITSDALNLSQNQYGNYVVQFILELRLPWATAGVIDKLEGSFGYLSMQKYSSHVVEKCLRFTGEDLRLRIVQELITDSRLDQILQDPYGNYVIQAALNHSKGVVHAALVEAIKPQVPALRTSPYGKKILSSNGLKK